LNRRTTREPALHDASPVLDREWVLLLLLVAVAVEITLKAGTLLYSLVDN